ncbi:MAG: ATP-binding protein [Omnitrophica WOR_2 bacterium]|jgi:predicted AAA+ superfamily ATPase
MQTYIERAIKVQFTNKLQPNKVLILLGARRTGKTFFLKKFLEDNISESYIFLNGEDLTVQASLSNRSIENYKLILGSVRLLVIDEAQKIPNIGLILKLMVDSIEGLKIIATGSSVFDISNKLGEPLTGRKYSLYLFPFAQMEMAKYENVIESRSRLEERLIYGMYPELIHIQGTSEKQDYLRELVNSYLLRDILEFEGVRNSEKMFALLRLIAFQIGKEVSLDELGRQLALSRNTVEKYLDLLSKVFIIHKLSGFSRNLRSEITKTSRWYFFDNGIRNTLINNFNPIVSRNDVGELWENWILAERLKFQHYTGQIANNYFWRTYEQNEIDWIEEKGGELSAYEIKWNPDKAIKAPAAWTKAYPTSTFSVIKTDNYLPWIM